MSKINWKTYLQENPKTEYALVTYEGQTVPLHFSYYDDTDCILESPIELWKCDIPQIAEVRNLLEDQSDENVINYYERYILPFIKGDYCWEVYAPQVFPFLPEMVDDIRPCTERDVIDFILGDN